MDLKNAKTIAVVGLSGNPERASFKVAKYLKENGYDIIPVNPTEAEVLGKTSYPDLMSLPAGISLDIVNIFRKSEAVGPIVDQAIKRRAKMIWMQEGIVNEEARKKAQDAGIDVVMDSCIMKVHKRLIGRDNMKYDLIIVGGGPAGLTAGLYGARGGLKTLLLEKSMPGGQAAMTERIENYPGFPQGIGGPELMMSFMEQATRFGAEFKTEEVNKVDFSSRDKLLVTENGNYSAPAVIIATGSRPRFLDVPGEKEYHGRGVSYCATCDGAFFREKKVLVAGGGDSALEEAMFLTKYAGEVVLVHRRDSFRAAKVLQERAKKNEKLRFVLDTVIEEIKGGSKGVEQVMLRNVKTGEVTAEPVDGVFVFVGNIPNTQFLAGAVELTEEGYIKTGDLLMTSVPGVFAAGDVRKKFLRQVSTAVGDGAEAAMAAERFINELE
ncbi:MAG: thioredoxin-disulfide reductase [Bacillota bacterium]|nr:thioredoxin-disulfide reductase [Clostridia bacterium]